MFGLMMALEIRGMLLGHPVEVVRVHPQEPMVQRQVNLQVLPNRKEVFLLLESQVERVDRLRRITLPMLPMC